MSGALYDSNPSMVRNHPFLFVLVILVIAGGATGAVLAQTGDQRMIGIAVAGVGIITLFIWFISCKALHLTVTEHGVSVRRGILSKNFTEVGLDRIRSVATRQSLFQRLFGVGSVDIFTAGDEPEISVNGMPDPERIRALLRRNDEGRE